MAIRYIFPHFGIFSPVFVMLHQEKSGNPDVSFAGSFFSRETLFFRPTFASIHNLVAKRSCKKERIGSCGSSSSSLVCCQTKKRKFEEKG
jgi:hypothetical protein